MNVQVGAIQATTDTPGTNANRRGMTTTSATEPAEYDKDEAVFTEFIQQHTIQQVQGRTTRGDHNNNINDDHHDDDDEWLVPNAAGARIRNVHCYLPHLQRIADRNFYHNDDDYHNNNNQQHAVVAEGPSSSSSPLSSTFIVEVPVDELIAWDAVRGSDLAQKALRNTLRYMDLFARVVDRIVQSLPRAQNGTTTTTTTTSAGSTLRDRFEVLNQQRLETEQINRFGRQAVQEVIDQAGAEGGGANPSQPQLHYEATEAFPEELLRRYELRILPRGRKGTFPPFHRQYHPPMKQGDTTVADRNEPLAHALRNIRASSMGHSVTLKGMVVRASDVKPYCQVATYSCDLCGVEVYQLIQNRREFMPAHKCPSEQCRNSKYETLHLQTRSSKFVKFQELRLQELPSQVPMGHIPRSLAIHCRGELTRLVSPGDIITVDGIFLPQRVAESGYRAMKAGLVSTTYLLAQNIIVHKKSYDESLSGSLSPEESTRLDVQIHHLATGPDPVGKLAASIAPEIFGHDDIKRSLLLQLVGGCTRKLPDGMRIRGDINICLMGDPGVAKSQLLKHVSAIAPRGVYTTGKGSSGVGLTAAVTKDLATGEMALEGGALVLADRGICCIDEFDKMDESDRTAIHEVMEQQTVSIAKAGIVATLNARTAVLAAANPLYGRYNRKKSLSENINLPNSLLSRFDLLFLVLDIADVDRDTALARHVTWVHQNEGLTDRNDESGLPPPSEHVSPQVLREYITRARQHHPVVSPEVAPYIVEAYVSLRMQDCPSGKRRRTESDQTVMTARQLLSILRLSQALARLRFSDYVAREDVDEAIRLTHQSKATLADESTSSSDPARRSEDATSRIFNILRDYATVSGSSEVELKLCEAMTLRKGFTLQQLHHCLETYEELQVLQINRTRTHLYFLDQ